MAALVAWLFGIPAAVIVSILVVRHNRFAEFANLAAAAVCLLLTFAILIMAPSHPVVWGDRFLLITPMGAWVLLCVSIVYFLASLYAIGYMRLLTEERDRLSQFYALFSAFALAMFVAPVMNNPGVYWIAIDLTTIVSAFLVGFERAAESAEAAWKYIIIVSAGLSLALLGIVLFYWAGTFVLGPVYAMTWAHLRTAAPHMPKVLMLLAYLLALVGFGTKVGLVPMHTWLPDAHSEGPAPVSAMLSGALLNTAMLGIVRFLGILHAGGEGSLGRLALLLLGLGSLAIAALFLVRQTGAKRLMAYSSVEHMGVLAVGFGFGGVLGIIGALYHMLNHSLSKSLMFFGAGNMMRAFKTRDMSGMRGILTAYPRTGLLWLLGAVAITGAPPFGLFRSEITILRAGMLRSDLPAVAIFAVFLIVIFIGFLNHFRMMYFGRELPHQQRPTLVLTGWLVMPMVLAFVPVLVLGLWWPAALWHYLGQAATVAL